MPQREYPQIDTFEALLDRGLPDIISERELNEVEARRLRPSVFVRLFLLSQSLNFWGVYLIYRDRT